MEQVHEERPSVGDLVRNRTLSVSAYFALWAGAGGVLHYLGWPAFSVIALAGGAAGAIVGLVFGRRRAGGSWSTGGGDFPRLPSSGRRPAC